MKNKQLVAILLLAALLIGITGCKASGDTALAETTIPSTTEDDGIFDEKDLLAILHTAGSMVESQDAVKMVNPSKYVRIFLQANSSTMADCYAEADNTITLTCVKENSDQRYIMNYCVFLYLLTSHYPDCVCDYHYDYNPMGGAYQMPILFFCPAYHELGFATPLDCLKAYEKKDYTERDNFFYIWFDDTLQIYEYDNGFLARYDYETGDYAK